MKKVMWLVALLVAVFTGAAFAEENTDSTSASSVEEKELGVKLKKAYDLYRKNDTVTLKQNEKQVSFGVTYASSNTAPVGWRYSTRSLSLNMSFSLGIADGLEASVSVPFSTISQRSETIYSVNADRNLTGFGNPTVQLIKTLSADNWNTSGIVSVTLPAGDRNLSSNETFTTVGVSTSKVFRPAFLSGGVSWGRSWKTARNSVNWNMGAGLFVNDTLTFGGDIEGVIYINPPMGAPRDYVSGGLRVAYQKTPDLGVTVSTNVGFTADAPQTSINFSVTKKL